MDQMDTNRITDAAAAEVVKLPQDKRLHFTASWGLGITGTPFETLVNSDDKITSFSILKEALDAYREGMRKEYADAGKDFAPMQGLLAAMSLQLRMAYDRAVADGMKDPKHETDLLANLAGIGLFVLNQSLMTLNLHFWEEPKHG